MFSFLKLGAGKMALPSYRGPNFNYQHPHSNSRMSVTPGPGVPTPSSDFCRHQHTCGAQTGMQAKQLHTKKIYIFKIPYFKVFFQRQSKEQLARMLSPLPKAPRDLEGHWPETPKDCFGQGGMGTYETPVGCGAQWQSQCDHHSGPVYPSSSLPGESN